MSDELRHALAVNLHRAGQTFEDLGRRATGAKAASRVEALEEMQTLADAGAAVWEAVTGGLLNVPSIASIIGGSISNGYARPNNGTECANVFLEVMREFLYPMGEGIFPNFSFKRQTHSAMEAGDKDTAQYQAMWRRHELQEWATGCHLLARLIEGGNDGKYRNDAERAELLERLSDALRKYAERIQKKETTGGRAEQDIITLVCQLKCYYEGQFPAEFASLWDRLMLATTPYYEDIGLAFETAVDMLEWVNQEKAGDRREVLNTDLPSPATTRPDDSTGCLPFWDKDKRELSLDGGVIRSYRKAAPNQTRILACFQEDGWPLRIDSPFLENAIDTKNDAIKALNNSIPQLRFWADGAQGIRWERRL